MWCIALYFIGNPADIEHVYLSWILTFSRGIHVFWLYVGQSISDETEYVEFTKAEVMVRNGGDPRLQALRKRLQSKKELLKQLDRMYSSYMGGSAAASKSWG